MIEDTEFAGPVSAGSDAHWTHASRGQGPKQKGEDSTGVVVVDWMKEGGWGAAYNPFLKSGARLLKGTLNLSDYFHTVPSCNFLIQIADYSLQPP